MDENGNVVCISTHLTSFAVLVDVNGPEVSSTSHLATNIPHNGHSVWKKEDVNAVQNDLQHLLYQACGDHMLARFPTGMYVVRISKELQSRTV